MALGGRVTLGENIGAGNGTAAHWPGGSGNLMATATFGGGSVKLQVQMPDGTYVDVDGVSLTAAGTKYFHLGPGLIRAVVTTASAVYVYAAVANDT
jgi:hypothetical protein